jgi:cell wall-associated NlpC family hydrolase
MSYDIPSEALSDAKFAAMITEAEKYLGYPYVWGGSSPSTSFDCSGFVSWVINNCGNGWNYGRQTANGLRSICTYVSPSEAKPGDLIFFEKTYNTTGASHVGIYVGNGMMIHCGNPIQYTSIETSYWQQHFLCFGRLP